MATIIKGLLSQNLPWGLVLVGVFISITLELCGIRSLSFAVGSYLPIATTAPIFAGGLVRGCVERRTGVAEESELGAGTLFSSGLIAGGSLCGILYAVLVGTKTDRAVPGDRERDAVVPRRNRRGADRQRAAVPGAGRRDRAHGASVTSCKLAADRRGGSDRNETAAVAVLCCSPLRCRRNPATTTRRATNIAALHRAPRVLPHAPGRRRRRAEAARQRRTASHDTTALAPRGEQGQHARRFGRGARRILGSRQVERRRSAPGGYDLRRTFGIDPEAGGRASAR